MKLTKKEIEKQVECIYNNTEALGNNAALMRTIDNVLYEVACMQDVIDKENPKADQFKQCINDLRSLSAILLPKFEREVQAVSDNVDLLTRGMAGLLE